ncbi:capsule biosynthesis protein [Phaeovulum vinaykumarii]|uniref:Capsular polysaccharide transport system permease protein n=1 Tax=Phaeovulum vinaykumarii TaxID=407234 RepID=A0A1N7JMQ0_9RHOB|nr:capsule biosynthesis protein [Phaeovulum vinaykumarii]SIS50595.1 capsular polysaccharide transport system permease protein [Phaeovulum vinaykumarii]SOB90331.1 capsular polysaccharide transport system permease protein [Phaeovulum vinaykumarii]
MTTVPKARRFRIRQAQTPAAAPAPTPADPAARTAHAAPAPVEPTGTEPRGTEPKAAKLAETTAESAPPSLRAGRGARKPDAQRRQGALFDNDDDGFGDQSFVRVAEAAARDKVLAPGEATPEEEIAAIRAEGLTGRQLRMARRLAAKHGIEATSDFEAVCLLRRQGINPFQPSSLLEMIAANRAQGAEPATATGGAGGGGAGGGAGGGTALARIDGPGADPRVQLPQTVRPGATLPSAEVMSEERRTREIMEMQRDIARRRRRRVMMLFARLSFFVFLPTLIAGLYYFVWATPLYATRTEFVIQQAEQQSVGGLGSLFSGTQLATNQDSVTVQSYLQSRDAMLRLDRDKGFKAHFSTPRIDPLKRLPENASNEQAYALYTDMVKIGYDPSEGVVKMEVIAADPAVSKDFSEALITYAEEQVDKLTQRLREDQMKGARESYQDAEFKVQVAQNRVLELQEQMGILDPVTETGVVMQQVGTFEVQLQQKKLELQALLDNPRPNQARVDGVRADISRLQNLIAELRAQLTQSDGQTSSLASVTGKLRIAEADLQTRQLMLSQAAQQLETARIEANKQVRYLSMGVRPVAPDEPTYPRAFENTVLAFLIFAGIYLMLSLTASILREQVSA